MKLIARMSVAAAVLVGLSIVLLQAMPRPLGGRAYDSDLSAAHERVEGARSATWKISDDQRYVGAGDTGSRGRWFRCKNEEQRHAYKAPGRISSRTAFGIGRPPTSTLGSRNAPGRSLGDLESAD